ncbi:GNAT family N-acetyltransferase [Microbacterium cremeum]|uniref:GNAT family N-acetyltransferase n=1 Tax=Microbacterium cremeum TaxID=2782169 RepID=UPI0018890EFD|nr:GNAT family N-acetyltransferase [Microbacterium cremeum]
MALTIRQATREDAAAITRIRIETWRAAYAGLIDGKVLAQFDPVTESRRRAERWDHMHADPRTRDVLAERDGAAVGWAAFGPSIDRELPRNGQLFALYAVPSEWSRGVGHALITAVEERLRASGFRHAHLWVLEGNDRAAAFYERHGWREDGAVMVDERVIGGHTPYTLHERRRVRDLSAAAADERDSTGGQD